MNDQSNINTLNNFNSFIQQASQTIACGTECQKQKKSELLKKLYLDAQTNLATAPNQLETAAKNYYTFTQGETGYNEYIESDLTAKANAIATMFKDNFVKDTSKCNAEINNYDGLLMNYQNVLELYLKYIKENNELANKLKDETSDILTNERKTYYQDQGIASLQFYYSKILIFIYILTVIVFAGSIFFYPSKYNWKFRLGIFIILLGLPFISTKLLYFVIYLFYKLYDLLPKNMHLTE